MNSIQVDMKSPPPVIHLGRRGENLSTEIIFDCSALSARYGMGHAELVHKSSHGIVYPVNLTQNGVLLHWNVTSCDTACEEIGKCELHWFVSDAVTISAEMSTLVYPSLSGQAGEEPPDGSAAWVNTVLQASRSAQESAQAAKTAPYIGESGTWFLYRADASGYTDSGLPARGEKGEKGDKGNKGDSPSLSSSVSSTSTQTAATSYAVKAAYDRIGQILHRTTYTTGQIIFPSAGYQKLTDRSALGLADEDQILSFHIQGWKSGSGALSLAQSSDGNSIYSFCSQASTFTSITLEVWYISGLSV